AADVRRAPRRLGQQLAREGRDPRRRSVSDSARAAQRPARRDEAGHAREIQRPGEALLRGAGEVTALVFALLLATPVSSDTKSEAKARLQNIDQLIDDWDI